MKLRPHHLLCTKAYEGKGYNKEFVENMNAKIELLKNEDIKVKIEIDLDDLCSACPYNKGDECETDVKVKRMDKKVLKNFNLECKEYLYRDLVQKIESKMTKDILDDICRECGWYEYGICQKHLLK